MPLTLRYDRTLTRAEGDQWLEIPALFTEPQVLIEYAQADIPQTWDYLGRVFQKTLVEGRWAVSEHQRIWPNRLTVVTWRQVPDDYLCDLRFVKYLKPGRLKVWGVS